MLCWSALALGGDIRFGAEMPVNEQEGSSVRRKNSAKSTAIRFINHT